MNRKFWSSFFSTANKNVRQFDDRPPYILVDVRRAKWLNQHYLRFSMETSELTERWVAETPEQFRSCQLPYPS
jgi:hypothetical protein